MKVGLSFSPGGLLLPYHSGVLASLEQCKKNMNGGGGLSMDLSTTPMAGSSAGSIATVAHACGIPPPKVLEATIALGEACPNARAQGNLLPLLKEAMEDLIGGNPSCWEALQSRPKGSTGVCYQELFPRYRSVMQTDFVDVEDVIQATLNSCMFPFFATPFPCRIDPRKGGLAVDGFFSLPRSQFGCPKWEEIDDTVEETIAVCVLPPETIRLTSFDQVIAPSSEDDQSRLFRIATTVTSRDDLTWAYELGWKNAESFCHHSNLFA